MNILRSARLALLPLLAVAFSVIMTAGLLVASPVPAAHSHLGQVLALRAALRPLVPSSARARAFQNLGAPKDTRRASDGRYVYRKPDLMHPGAIVRPRAAGTTTPQVDEAVQTFDVFNPPPAFALASGQSLTPTNLTPVWTADETMLIFSSNRTSTGTAGTRFHIWAIPVNGGTPVQLTSSTAAAGETAGLPHGEFFPALSAGNNQVLAFTSDANTANVQNLYVTSFPGTLFMVNGQPSLTSQGATTGGVPVTGFSGVQRPAFAPGNDDEVVFSALSVTGTYAGHQHLYFLYRSTGGYSQSTISLPGKITDGPADDTDPAFSQDGQYLAFASTGTVLSATGEAPSSDPNTAPVATSAATGTTAGSNRSIFLVTSGGALVSFTQKPPTGLPVTVPGTDNFAPAWSSAQTNPYLNAAPGFEYIAFSRGAAQGQPHDIYYLKLLQNTQAGGESSRSNEASSTPINSQLAPSFGPVFQVNAGGTTFAETYGGYVPDTFINGNTGLPSFIVTGGTADPPANPPTVFNTAGDPNTPPQIYQTDRSGTFSYEFPNLTPNANYLVRLHLADPKDKVAGARIFNVTINGNTTEPNIDIVATAQSAPGQIDGEVTDATTGAAIASATVTVQSTPTVTFTTTATTSPDPSGAATPINYSGAVTPGTYTVTATAPGYGTSSHIVTITSASFSRTDFALDPDTAGTASFSGTIVDNNGVGVSGATITVVDPATLSTVVTSPAAPSAATSGSYGTVTLAPGTYYITATPPAGSSFTTQTQTVTIAAGASPTVNFTLQPRTSTTVGSLGGLVTNSVTLASVPNVVITVTGASGVVAVLTTGASFATPAAPFGDGAAANFFAYLPDGSYTLSFNEPGFAVVTQSVTVGSSTPAGSTTPTTFIRANQALTTTTPGAGEPVAVVVEYEVSVPAFDSFNNTGLNIAPAGAITLAFNPVSGDPPIVQGIEILADPNPARSSGFGSLATTNLNTVSTAPTISVFGGTSVAAANGATTYSPFTTVNITNQNSLPPVAYNIYRSAGSPNSDNQPPLSGAGTESGTVYQTITPSTTSATTVFTDPNVNFSSEYYYQVTSVFQEAIVPEGQSNPVTQLNTSDPGNAYDDIYPTWSPFRTIFSIAYSSNRSVTYTVPGTGAASETAISIGANGSLGNGGMVGAGYAGILESQVVNLDPPTLVPYNGNEVCHVNAGTAYNAAVSSRTGITPGQDATITVRLSDREAGVDDNNIYLQIKNPNSKYQTASGSNGLEHKVFASDFAFRTQTNNPNSTNLDSGSSALLINGGGYSGFNQFSINGTTYFAPQRGSIGGIDGPESDTGSNGSASAVNDTPVAPVGPSANKSDTISVGRDGGGTNTQPVLDSSGKQVLDANKNPAVLPGGDPTKFIPTGPEYECQVVNPTFAGLDTVQTDFTNPYYLAGVDDQEPFSGYAPIVARPSTEWLKMTRLPAAQQDGQGGILYSVTWRTPTTGSDFFLDVIAFDLAAPPSGYSQPAGSTSFISFGGNWRIYDNVWGFSTAASDTTNDILLVSDYALGQKFAASTFGGQRGLVNLVPKLFGAESYVSDIDSSLLPNAIYRYAVYPGANANQPQSEVLDLSTAYDPADNPNGFFENFGGQFSSYLGISVLPLNGLGVNSYYDRFIDDGGRSADQLPSVRSQQYSIWRTLSRGPVPASVYAAYEPTIQTQPAVSDASGPTEVTVAAGQVAVANRCIVWISPFTGDVLAGPGTLIDPNTQANLRAFVAAGGRLCVSGQDVGSALTQNGTVNNTTGGFLSDVLNATLASPNQGTQIPEGGNSPANNRISDIASYDGELQGGYQEVNTIFGQNTTAPSARPIIVSNNYGGNIFQSINLGPQLTASYSGNWRTDGSLDQLGPYIQGFPEQSNNTNSVVGQIDTIKPNAGANVHTDITLQAFTNPLPLLDNGNANAASAPGGVGLIYSESPLATGGTGSKVVYSTFGLEALSTEYYRQTASPKPNPILYAARNQRQNILHNIVSYLRTGSISGSIRATTGNNTVGAGIPGATVYLQSAYGPAIPGRGTFSATTDGSGNYNITGVEPGNYTLVAYATGYTRAVSNQGTVFTVEGDVAVSGANLTLQSAGFGSITGVVTNSSSQPVSGATVTFTTSTGQSQQTTTQSNGTYTLANVPAGTYTGTATATGSSATSGATAVTSGATITVNFQLAPGAGNATGSVVDTNGSPIAGATVFFNGGGLTSPATTTTSATGTYTFAAGSLPAGNYVVTAAATGYGNSTPVQVTITSAATTTVPEIVLGVVQNGTLGGLVTATGSATPLAGVTITIVNTATNTAVTPAPVSVGTATTGPDGSSLNYGPVTLPQGTYTVTASQSGVSSPSQSVTVPANGFVRADFTGTSGLAPLYTFPAGIQFVSTPYDYSALGFSGLFGTLNTAPAGTTPNGNRSNVAVWNPAAGAYALDPNAPADALRLGVGYWVYLKNATPVTQSGTPIIGSVQVSLNPAWNQIGAPSTAGVPISSLTFTGADGVAHSFADATSSTYHLVSPTLYSYNGSSYTAIGAGATLQPWQGYWIQVYTPVTMSIPTGK